MPMSLIGKKTNYKSSPAKQDMELCLYRHPPQILERIKVVTFNFLWDYKKNSIPTEMITRPIKKVDWECQIQKLNA